MAEYRFPATVYDQPDALLTALGSWWSEDYAGVDQVRTLVQGKAQVESQTLQDVQELIAAMNRFTVPIYHTVNWYPLFLRASQRNTAQLTMGRYDTGLLYDAGDSYDRPRPTVTHAFPKPDQLKHVSLITNQFTTPSLLWSAGLNFTVTNDAIVFAENPFDDPRVATSPIYQDGQVVDTEAVLWLYRSQFDWQLLYQQFGYVFGIQDESSEQYRTLLNAFYNSVVGGTSRQDILDLCAAVLRVPLVRETQERVDVITSDHRNTIIVTDKHVYKFDLTATPLVTVGDIVYRGQPLTDALRVDELSRGVVPEGLTELEIPAALLAPCFHRSLTFRNENTPLIVTPANPPDFTRVEWSLGGHAADVTRFFDLLHERGVAEALRPIDQCQPGATVRYPAADCTDPGQVVRRGTLAHLLDRRPHPVGEPQARDLPATINPLQFLIQNVLRNNTTLIRIKPPQGASWAEMQNLRLLHKMVPPHTVLLILVEWPEHTETVTPATIPEPEQA